jgi:hypothetical protein
LLKDHYGAVTQNITTGEIINTIDYPLYDIDLNGHLGLSLNFSRLQCLRPGYGYVNVPDSTLNDCASKDDGIWLVDLLGNRVSLLFSLAQIASIEPHDSMRNMHHYFNHLSFNPSGTSFMFFHLWRDEDNQEHQRLFTASTQGNRLILLNNTGYVSHYTWLSDNQLVITARPIQTQHRYIQYHYINGFEGIVGDSHLKRDGHPTFIKNGKFMVTDTYPSNRLREQKTLLYDLDSDRIKIIDTVFLPSAFKEEVRCDLHPRPSPSGNLICIDVVVDNHRAVKVVDISRYHRGEV